MHHPAGDLQHTAKLYATAHHFVVQRIEFVVFLVIMVADMIVGQMHLMEGHAQTLYLTGQFLHLGLPVVLHEAALMSLHHTAQIQIYIVKAHPMQPADSL